MLSSLRARVLVWYTSLLAAVILLFGVAVGLAAWRARIAEVDALLAARAEALAAALVPAADGTFDLTLPPDPPRAAVNGPPALYHVLWTPSGEVIDRSDSGLEVPVPPGPGARSRAGGREVTRLAATGAFVLVGRSTADIRAEIWTLGVRMGAIGLAALALALGGGWLLVGRALAPIDRISATARAMTEGDFTARIPVEQVETELGQLARSLNEAFDRLHVSLEQQRRFTADASHELRTPLATMSTEVQWALARERDPDAYRTSLAACRRAVDRMAAIVERLLTLARAEATVDAAKREPVRLDELVVRTAADLSSLAKLRHLTLDVKASPVTVSGDPDRLVDAVTNLVGNAIHYNVENGTIAIRIDANGSLARLTVTDTGIGIAAGDLPRIFEPFFRADPARSRDAGGAGLGLAVTKAIVERHGGRIICTSQPGRGTTMTVELPQA